MKQFPLICGNSKISEKFRPIYGRLSDCNSCLVTEELNGDFYLQLQYPVGGYLFKHLKVGNVILCKSNLTSNQQEFIIDNVGKALRGNVSVRATHCSSKLNDVVTMPFFAVSSTDFMFKLGDFTIDSLFDFKADFSISRNVDITEPVPVKTALLGKNSDSFIKTYGGEFEYDNYFVTAKKRRGDDTSIEIRYGVNLLTLSQSQNKRDFFTAVIPFWKNSEMGQIVTLPEKILYADAENADVFKQIPIDLSSQFKTAPSDEDLREAAITWVSENKLDRPRDTVKISFVDLSKTEEYKHILPAQDVSIGDSLVLYYEDFDLSDRIRVVATTYNVLKDRHDLIILGDLPSSFPQTLLKMGGRVK